MVSFKYELGRCLLQQALDRRRMSQQELADLVGSTKQQINAFIHGRRKMSLANCYSIAKALNCSVDEIYEFVPVRSRIE